MNDSAPDVRHTSIALSWVYCGLALALIALGLGLRLLPLGLPVALVKWGGSALWAGMVYFLVAAVLPRSECWRIALLTCGIAALVELSRLWHTPGLDAFRGTRAGILLLGRVFQWWHFAVYWVTIAGAAVADARLVRSGRNSTQEGRTAR